MICVCTGILLKTVLVDCNLRNECCVNDWQLVLIKKITILSGHNQNRLPVTGSTAAHRNVTMLAKTSRSQVAHLSWKWSEKQILGEVVWQKCLLHLQWIALLAFFVPSTPAGNYFKKVQFGCLWRKAIFWSLESWQSQTNCCRQHGAENTSVRVWLGEETKVSVFRTWRVSWLSRESTVAAAGLIWSTFELWQGWGWDGVVG